MIDEFFIDDPRSDSEIYNLLDYMTLFITNNILTVRLEKRYIARYSRISNNLKTTDEFVFITRSIGN